MVHHCDQLNLGSKWRDWKKGCHGRRSSPPGVSGSSTGGLGTCLMFPTPASPSSSTTASPNCGASATRCCGAQRTAPPREVGPRHVNARVHGLRCYAWPRRGHAILQAHRCELLLAVLLLTACGGTPVTPTPTTSLTAGRFVLRVESTVTPLASGGAGGAVLVCSGRVDNVATVIVDLVPDGSGWRGTMTGATLSVTLQPSGQELCGQIEGTATASDGTVVQFGKDSSIKSTVSGSGLCGKVSSDTVSGSVTADVTFHYPNAAASSPSFGHCGGNVFSLKPV